MSPVRRPYPPLAAAVLALATLAHPALVGAQGCAMCGTAFAPDDPVTQAFSWSILFLIAMPYTLCAVVGAWLYFAYRRADERRRGQVIDLSRLREASASTERS